MTSRMTKFVLHVLFLFIIHCSCSLLTVTYVKAETVSLLRRAPWQYEAIEGNHDEAVATALLRNEINETGWAMLEIQGTPTLSDEEMAYAAGYAEGLVTGELIYMTYMNSFGGKQYCGEPSQFCDQLRGFVTKNQQYMEQQRAKYPDSPFWHQVYLYQQQLKGMRDGYSNNTDLPSLPDESFLFLQISEDIDDLETAFSMKKSEKSPILNSNAGSCSALIKVLPGNSDLYTAHDTWADYHSMLRMIKLYDLPYHTSPDSDQVIPAQRIAMSSYPGKLQSQDDYHLTSSGLVAMETTNEYNNSNLLNDITPQCVFEPIRVMVANRLAYTGRDWVQTFARENSGTYNNQWMVVDYKLFTPGQDLPKANLLWVLEQLPGNIVFGDQTNVLREKTYWASYNIPYYSTIFNVSGGVGGVPKKDASYFLHNEAPRAKIFARNNTDVVDMNSMMALMRYNNFQHDPLSQCDCSPPYSSENAIAARSDLNPANGTYPFPFLGHRRHGATDTKITSHSMMPDLSFMAVSGPTSRQQPVFQWSKADFGDKPMGQPDKFDFQPIQVNWSQ